MIGEANMYLVRFLAIRSCGTVATVLMCLTRFAELMRPGTRPMIQRLDRIEFHDDTAVLEQGGSLMLPFESPVIYAPAAP
jgi:hypothetical protein